MAPIQSLNWQIVVALGSSVAACAGAPPAQISVVDTTPALVKSPEPTKATDTPLPPPDEQETESPPDLNTYRTAGVPAVNRPWGPNDYHAALEVFGAMAKVNRKALPRADSNTSGALFARLIDLRNFANVSSTGGAQLAADYLEVIPYLLGVYAPRSDQLDFAAEQTALVELIIALLDLALEASGSAAAQDPDWRLRYEQQQNLAVGIVGGASAMLGETQRYSEHQRDSLKSCLRRHVPRLTAHMKVRQRQNIHEQLTHWNIPD